MTTLDAWLRRVTLYLSTESESQLCSEIREHYEAALEAAIEEGATPSAAIVKALSDLGDAAVANRRYRKILLTRNEARMLSEAEWESNRCRPWLGLALRATPVTMLGAAASAFIFEYYFVAQWLLLIGTAGVFFLAMPTWRASYSPSRARVIRWIKWVTLAIIIGAVALSSRATEWIGVLTLCAGGIAWTEWVRHSIRRKLPIEKWPKALYP